AYFERKNAATINTELIGWLRGRPKGRPYFAFLNYYDAHDPYLTPEEEGQRSSRASRSAAELEVLRDWHRASRSGVRPEHVRLARESYEECVGYLDRQIGRLFADLEAMGALENTIVVITSDHGEEFGEHGIFGHGQRLYSQVLHVPLLVIGPGRIPAGRRVATPVSLRCLPSTLVDLLGLSGSSSPFPGASLARYWDDRGEDGGGAGNPIVLSEIDDDDGRRREGPPSRAIVSEGMVYIRADGEREEMYDLWNDPAEAHDLSRNPAYRATLARLRRLTDGRAVEALATGPTPDLSPSRR
ncbi:MAG: sulfatase family protein, partial [Isosphaeraceae bacterium]